jgi:hypothetical protein
MKLSRGYAYVTSSPFSHTDLVEEHLLLSIDPIQQIGDDVV